VDSCLQTKFESGLMILHDAKEDAINRLNSVTTTALANSRPGLFCHLTYNSSVKHNSKQWPGAADEEIMHNTSSTFLTD